MSWRGLAKWSWKRLEDVLKTFLEDVLQIRLEDVLEDEKLLCWRRLEDVLKNKKCWLGYYFALINNTFFPIKSCNFYPHLSLGISFNLLHDCCILNIGPITLQISFKGSPGNLIKYDSYFPTVYWTRKKLEVQYKLIFQNITFRYCP